MVCVYHSNRDKKLIKVNGKIIGHTEGNKFIKPVCGSKHKLRCPPAWCLSAMVFEQLVISGIREIAIQDNESNLTYRSSINNFAKHCFPIQRGSFEKQLALPEKKWKVEGNHNKQLSLLEWGMSNA